MAIISNRYKYKNRMRIIYSIILISKNNVQDLIETIERLNNFSLCEIVIINFNFDEESNIQKEKYLESRADQRISYFKCEKGMNIAQALNIGLEIIRGDWVIFLNDSKLITNNFINDSSFIRLSKINNFYRLPIVEQNKKIKPFFWSKYSTLDISSFIFNKEWLDSTGIHFNQSINNEKNVWAFFINQIYRQNNLEYDFIKRTFLSVDKQGIWEKESFEISSLLNDFFVVSNKKILYYKQFIIILLKKYETYFKIQKNYNDFLKMAKLVFKKAKINIFTFWRFGLISYIKTFIFKYKVFFINSKKVSSYNLIPKKDVSNGIVLDNENTKQNMISNSTNNKKNKKTSSILNKIKKKNSENQQNKAKK